MGLEKLLSVDDVAQAIGMTIFGVYGLVHKKQIPAVRISKRCLRFRPSDIEAWLESKTQEVRQKAGLKPITGQGKSGKKGIFSRDHVSRLVEKAKKEVLK